MALVPYDYEFGGSHPNALLFAASFIIEARYIESDRDDDRVVIEAVYAEGDPALTGEKPNTIPVDLLTDCDPAWMRPLAKEVAKCAQDDPWFINLTRQLDSPGFGLSRRDAQRIDDWDGELGAAA